MTNEELDSIAVKEFQIDLREMSDQEVENEISDIEERISELEPWLEALTAEQRIRARQSSH